MDRSEEQRRIHTEIQKLRVKIIELEKMLPAGEACGVCANDPAWVKCTQFTGDHFYCDKHAREHKDFGCDGGSYYFWTPIDEYVSLDEEIEKMRRGE